MTGARSGPSATSDAAALPRPEEGVGQIVWAAVRANLVPGVILWTALALFLMGYAFSANVQQAMVAWAEAKRAVGPGFAVGSYVVFAVVLPEALSHALRREWPNARGWADMAFAAVMFGSLGWMVDVFYLYQVAWFGEGSDARTLIQKTLVDQLVFAPLTTLMSMTLLLWRDAGFAPAFWRTLGEAPFWTRRFVPVMVALWCVWLPSIVAIYGLPTGLQFPVVSVVLSFWILIFKFVRER